ncbi:hypothetical protein LIER_44126 [Lithospermum erythrorhizon]|uniref:Non-specific serine/threonine protein kinase n=1 Tax=Lithospermum erythrorhizon TaxID=34254 RepID=A0AAV3Q4X2_LITER
MAHLNFSQLTTLALSDNTFIVEPDILKLLLTNFTKLSHDSLTSCNIPSSIPTNISSFLEIVHLDYNNFHGKLPQSIFHLPNLKALRLGGNLQLCRLLPSVRWNSYRTLQWLDLSGIQFSGEIPDSIGNLNPLKYLNLLYCGFSGTIKSAMLLSLSSLQGLQLSKN